MKQEFRQKLIGISAIILLLLLIVLIFYMTFNHIFPGLWPLLKAGDEQGIARYLELEGEWKGLILAVVLSALQVVSIVLPGLPIHLAVGMIYGWVKASIACYIGFVLGNAFVFAVARKLGRRLGNYIPGLNRQNWLTQKINSRHPAFVVAIACMVPGRAERRDTVYCVSCGYNRSWVCRRRGGDRLVAVRYELPMWLLSDSRAVPRRRDRVHCAAPHHRADQLEERSTAGKIEVNVCNHPAGLERPAGFFVRTLLLSSSECI